jgi:hypothetical protein
VVVCAAQRCALNVGGTPGASLSTQLMTNHWQPYDV